MLEMAIEICKAVARVGGKAYFAGGWVRDQLRQVESNDIDIEVFGLEQSVLEGILAYFGEVKLVGRAYGVYKIGDLDISMPRTEVQKGPKHRDLEVIVDKNLDLETACRRRDFTMNAMLFDPLTNELFDFFDGDEDTLRGIIRHVSNDTFIEDPLRILRAARFRATFDFVVAASTETVCLHNAWKIKDLPKERIFWELEKVLLKAKTPSSFFNFLRLIDALQYFFPELYTLQSVDQGDTYHREGDAYVHTMMAIDSIPVEERELSVMLATLFHDLGKINTRSENVTGVHFYGHQIEGVPLVEKAMSRITNDVVLTEEVISLTRHHMDVYPLIEHCRKRSVRKLAAKVDIYKLMKLHKGDRLGRGNPASIDHIERIISVFEEVKDEIKPLILGRHLIELGAKPGKHFSSILNAIWEAQLDGAFSTVEDGVAYVRTKIQDW